MPRAGSLQEIGATASRLAEIEGIRRALAAAGGNREKAADQLKVSGKTLQAKIEEYGIEIPSQEGAVDRRDRRTR